MLQSSEFKFSKYILLIVSICVFVMDSREELSPQVINLWISTHSVNVCYIITTKFQELEIYKQE